MARRRYTEQEKARLVRECEHRGIAASAFCRQRGIPYQSFLKWRAHRRARRLPRKSAGEFLEFEVAAPTQCVVARTATVVELNLGPQTVLRIFTGGAPNP